MKAQASKLNWMMLGMCSAWIFAMLDLTLYVDLPECTGPTLRCGSTRRTLVLLSKNSDVRKWMLRMMSVWGIESKNPTKS